MSCSSSCNGSGQTPGTQNLVFLNKIFYENSASSFPSVRIIRAATVDVPAAKADAKAAETVPVTAAAIVATDAAAVMSVVAHLTSKSHLPAPLPLPIPVVLSIPSLSAAKRS